MQIPDHFQIDFAPLADEKAVVVAGRARFTILTARLLRLEYSPDGQFEDRPSQMAWYRRQSVPDFTVEDDGQTLLIETHYLRLQYDRRIETFQPESLSITLKDTDTVWHMGDSDPLNLKGTNRTLDNYNGAAPLEMGLMSRSGWALVDDSVTPVFNDQCWLRAREAVPGTYDLYFFGYGQAYQDCSDDYCRLSGPVPLLPRWSLGNWWSRYWEYTQDELIQLVEDFQQYDYPLSVCIIDMDWHITDTGNVASGWTGYTWNTDLIPDPVALTQFFHENNIRTALNLHPADGVYPHEADYPAMARRLGIDPETQEPVPFNIPNPEFAQAYFELLHHPKEATGVDFWWLDWQQGEDSGVPGIDPLWWLNHLHFYDLARDGSKRPFIFSRWGGLGNHRYPIGFSGDTQISWETLAFQPYMTATAANVGYGWWSHDIGGHYMGIEEPELYTRWTQYGVFSPILRIHTSKNTFLDRRPWLISDLNAQKALRDAMQLRHRLIPYIYTLSWQAYHENKLPIRPMYYDYPDQEPAYYCPDQYTFGPNLIAAPYVAPMDPDTGLSRQVVWLPAGDWYHVFDGAYYAGDSWHVRYGNLDDIPVFARAGAIVPMGPADSIDNPAELDVQVFVGCNGEFTLYEDDGTTNAYHNGAFCMTTFKQAWQDDRMTITINPTQGQTDLIPVERVYRLHFVGVRDVAPMVTVNGDAVTVDSHYDPVRETLTVSLGAVMIDSKVVVVLSAGKAGLLARRDRRLEQAQAMVHAFRLPVKIKPILFEELPRCLEDPKALNRYGIHLMPSQLRALHEIMHGVGLQVLYDRHHAVQIVLWNNDSRDGFTYQYRQTDLTLWIEQERFVFDAGEVPRFKAIVPDLQTSRTGKEVNTWHIRADYLRTVTLEDGRKAT